MSLSLVAIGPSHPLRGKLKPHTQCQMEVMHILHLTAVFNQGAQYPEYMYSQYFHTLCVFHAVLEHKPLYSTSAAV